MCVLTNKHLLMEQGPEAQEEDESDQAHDTNEPHRAVPYRSQQSQQSRG